MQLKDSFGKISAVLAFIIDTSFLDSVGISALHFGLVSMLSLWIGISAFHFGLVSAPFTLDWYWQDPSCIGVVLHFGSGISCDLWILGINWHQLGPLDKYQLGPLKTCVKFRKVTLTFQNFNFF
ncbi:hypothetical protein RhiirC2_791327 [Rhizophagus irregularis]|uniref:Uncharacterized protein n=1 Tax=Rhizophagus irregularis TaxID=588596 RepID=A0A2N1MJE6_9GLOM|nr:hypothetical protein RhiirC2_791327 [Rhizophagus irregularis]